MDWAEVREKSGRGLEATSTTALFATLRFLVPFSVMHAVFCGLELHGTAT